MMRDPSFRHDKDEIKELLRLFENLKAGRSQSFLEEEAFEKLVDYFDDQDDIAKALEASQYALEQYPYSAGLHLKRADILIAARQYTEALDLLEKATTLDDSNIHLYILKTDVYLAMDKQAKAVEILEEALGKFEGEEQVELLFELADVYDDYEEFDKLFDCLKLILDQEPTNEEALYKICFWTDFTGRNEESVKLHMRIINQHPYNELAWFNLGAAYQGIKLYEKAIDAYAYAIAIDEKFDYAYRNMGDAYIRLRKYKDAIEVLEKVLELSRPEDVIYEAIGHCHDKMNHYAQARFYYRKASHLNTGDSKLLFKIAGTYMNESQFGQAIKHLEAAMRIHQQVPEYNLAMGECYLQQGSIKEAIQYFSNVVAYKPKNVSGWEALVRCLYGNDQYEMALEQVTAAIHHTQGRPLFLYYLSAIYFALGKSKEGLLQLENALKISPKLLRQFVELNPSILQNQQVVDVIARNKRK